MYVEKKKRYFFIHLQVITDCLAVVGSILAERPPMMTALTRNASAREFVVSTLARNPAPRVRRQMGDVLVGAKPMAGTLLRWLTGELQVLFCRCFFPPIRIKFRAGYRM